MGRGEGMEYSLKQKRLAFPRTDEAVERSATWCPRQECSRFQGAWRESPSCKRELLEVWDVIRGDF